MLKDNLKKARMKTGLTQKQVAEKMNITQQQYGFWETGKRVPNEDNLKHLAETFNTTTDALKGRDDGLEDIISTLRTYDPTEEEKEHIRSYIESYLKNRRWLSSVTTSEDTEKAIWFFKNQIAFLCVNTTHDKKITVYNFGELTVIFQ